MPPYQYFVRSIGSLMKLAIKSSVLLREHRQSCCNRLKQHNYNVTNTAKEDFAAQRLSHLLIHLSSFSKERSGRDLGAVGTRCRTYSRYLPTYLVLPCLFGLISCKPTHLLLITSLYKNIKSC